MANRFFSIASFAAATIVYKTEKVLRRPHGESKRCKQCVDEESEKFRIQSAIAQARKQIMRVKNEVGAPGIIVGVSVDGKVIWEEGIGFSDLENEVPANENTVMRIASISKSLTAAMVGRLWEEGKIKLDLPIQKYVPSFPEKTVGDKQVTISTKQLMCHLSGIRHYYSVKKDNSMGSGDGQLEEFYGKEKYESVEKALSIFKDDDLLHPPGTKYLYTTYGWTLISAVMEGATGKKYPQLFRSFLRDIGMRSTYLDEHEPIIYGRSRYYGKNKNGKIQNSPYVDNSCKWAGGGIISTVGDLLKFANAMLYAYQFGDVIDVRKHGQMKVSNAVSGEDREVKSSTVEVGGQAEAAAKMVVEGETSAGGHILNKTQSWYSKEEERKSSDDEEEKRVSNVDKIKEIGGHAGEAAKSVVEGAASVGSKVWNSAWSWYGKEKEGKSGDDEEEKRVINVDKIKEVGGHAGEAAKSVVQGAASVGSNVWNSAWSWYGKEKEGKSGDDEEEKRVSNVDKIKEVGGHAGEAAKSVVEGAASVGSNVWNSAWSWYGKEKEGKSGDDEEEKRVINVDKIKEVGGHAGEAAKSVVEGAASVGSNVWNSAWSWYGKEKEGKSGDDEEEKRVSNVDKIKEVGGHAGEAAKSVVEGAASVGSNVWNSAWSWYGKEKEGKSGDDEEEKRVSNVDKIKEVGGHAGEAAKSVVEGAASVGSNVWNSAWSWYGKEKEGKSGDDEEEKRVSNVDKIKEVGGHAGEAAKSVWKGVAGAGSYFWGKEWRTSGNQTEEENGSSEKALSGSKEDTKDEQDYKSWINFNIFRPKALDISSGKAFNHECMPLGKESLVKIPFRNDMIFQGIFMRKIIPCAVSVVLGVEDEDLDILICGNEKEALPLEVEGFSMDEEAVPLTCARHLDFTSERSEQKLDKRPYLSQKTITFLWTLVEKTKFSDWGPCVEGGYGLGFGVAPAIDCPGGVEDGGQPFMVGHTGGAVGASSAFIIMPRDCVKSCPPKGVAVVILANLQSVNLNPLAINIARIFANASQ